MWVVNEKIFADRVAKEHCGVCVCGENPVESIPCWECHKHSPKSNFKAKDFEKYKKDFEKRVDNQ